GMLHHHTAGVAVSSLESSILQPPMQRDFSHPTLLCRCGDRRAGEEGGNRLVLLAGDGPRGFHFLAIPVIPPYDGPAMILLVTPIGNPCIIVTLAFQCKCITVLLFC